MNSVIGIYDNFDKAIAAVAELQTAGYPVSSMSILGKTMDGKTDNDGLHLNEAAAGRLLDKSFSYFTEAAVYKVPELGFLFAGGGVVGTLANLNRKEAYAGLSQMLKHIGVYADLIGNYCENVERGKYLLIAHGTTTDITIASEIMERHITYSEAADNHVKKFDLSAWIKNLDTDFPLGG
ncbi:MAG: hypothetical protein EBZ77_03520 [Chitinophagia bacterium]|nr:hypothetical protein [Chitinophagia bacterium]